MFQDISHDPSKAGKVSFKQGQTNYSRTPVENRVKLEIKNRLNLTWDRYIFERRIEI